MAEKKQAIPPRRRRPGHPHTPLIEWIAALVSTLLVLWLLGYTAWEAFTHEERPPIIAVRADSVIAAPGGFLVLFTARNEGGETAAALNVVGALRADSTTVEESQATIDFLPLGGERRGGLFFTRDPRHLSLELRAAGFDTP
jgi:uncharacterized protein (TIGR02588 family)